MPFENDSGSTRTQTRLYGLVLVLTHIFACVVFYLICFLLLQYWDNFVLCEVIKCTRRAYRSSVPIIFHKQQLHCSCYNTVGQFEGNEKTLPCLKRIRILWVILRFLSWKLEPLLTLQYLLIPKIRFSISTDLEWPPRSPLTRKSSHTRMWKYQFLRRVKIWDRTRGEKFKNDSKNSNLL